MDVKINTKNKINEYGEREHLLQFDIHTLY